MALGSLLLGEWAWVVCLWGDGPGQFAYEGMGLAICLWGDCPGQFAYGGDGPGQFANGRGGPGQFAYGKMARGNLLLREWALQYIYGEMALGNLLMGGWPWAVCLWELVEPRFVLFSYQHGCCNYSYYNLGWWKFNFVLIFDYKLQSFQDY